ncbi:unnamed protein product, partial [Timema podura]|nr:unnamed protein product [Timema podura]
MPPGGFGVTTLTVNIAGSCNSKGEVSSKRQKHEQPSASSKSSSNHKKRHTSTDENRGILVLTAGCPDGSILVLTAGCPDGSILVLTAGCTDDCFRLAPDSRKTKEKSHLTCEDHDKPSRPGAPGQSSGGSGSRTSTSLSEGESSSEVEETARGRLQRAAATLLETDNNSFFSANSFTKVTPTAANSGTSEWLQNGLSLAHMPDVLPPVHSSEDWQAAFGFANSSHGDTSPPRHDPLPELAQSGPPSADDSGQTQQVFNGTGAPLDGVAVPHKFVLARGPAEDYHIQQEHLNHNGVSFRTEVPGVVAANSTDQTRQHMFPAHTSPSFVQDPAVFLLARHPPPQQQYLANGHQHLIHNGLLPASKFLADFHMRQAHNSQVLHNHPLTPSDGDGYSGGGGLLANGTGVHSKFTHEFGAMLETGGGVTGSNHPGAGSKMNGDVSVIGENGVDENYAVFPGNDNCRHNGYLDYGAEHAEDDRITDDLGFDPFHETQKALAEMMEKESSMMQSGQQLAHHNHILPQQYRQHMPTQLSFPPGGSGSKLLSAYGSQQQNHRYFSLCQS